jgi:trk system potassium uptake protein TrkA
VVRVGVIPPAPREYRHRIGGGVGGRDPAGHGTLFTKPQRPDLEAANVHVVIMGCGRVGSTLAHSLEARGHSVAVIDQDGDAFRRLSPDFAGKTVTGVGFDHEVLKQAGIEHADAFAAVSSGDNSNIISARLARETFGVQRVVARIYDQRRAEVYERLGIPTVATVRWTADRVFRHLVPEGAAELWRDPTSTVAIVEVPVHEGWIGHSLTALEEATGTRTAYIMRFGIGTLPTASTVLQDGDQVFMLVTDAIADSVSKITAAAPTTA